MKIHKPCFLFGVGMWMDGVRENGWGERDGIRRYLNLVEILEVQYGTVTFDLIRDRFAMNKS